MNDVYDFRVSLPIARLAAAQAAIDRAATASSG